jgi:hypothetical protein
MEKLIVLPEERDVTFWLIVFCFSRLVGLLLLGVKRLLVGDNGGKV